MTIKRWFRARPAWLQGALLAYPLLLVFIVLWGSITAVREGGACIPELSPDPASFAACYGNAAFALFFYTMLYPAIAANALRTPATANALTLLLMGYSLFIWPLIGAGAGWVVDRCRKSLRR